MEMYGVQQAEGNLASSDVSGGQNYKKWIIFREGQLVKLFRKGNSAEYFIYSLLTDTQQ